MLIKVTTDTLCNFLSQQQTYFKDRQNQTKSGTTH